ncbi:MAG: MarP family serine protease [Actinomycetota bacterium]
MNWVDLIIVVAVFASAAHGLLQGAAVQLFSFGGFGIGLVLGALIAPTITRGFNDDLSRVMASVVTVFGLAGLLGGAGRYLGVRVWGALRRLRLGAADAALGAGIATLATLLAVWLIADMFKYTGVPAISSTIQSSVVIRGLYGTLSSPPPVFSRIARLLYPSGLPPPFVELEPTPARPVPLPSAPEVEAAVAAARESTVRVSGIGCGGVKSGSGFVVGAGTVVTNAHVVAGIDRPFVEDSRGRHRATPVYFDPETDLAILRASGLAGRPLPLVRSIARRGQTGAVLGYPGGGLFEASPASIRTAFDAAGRDIYGEQVITRNVYQLDVKVVPGNSGGPFVRSDGHVLGVIFSTSAIRDSIGYALTVEEVGPAIDREQTLRESVDTGECTR